MKRLYEKHYDTEELTARITDSDLRDASVLVLYDPDKALTSDEIRAVQDFVNRGGGLFVIGDQDPHYAIDEVAVLRGRCNVDLLVLPEVDHSLRRVGDVATSLRALGRTIDAVRRFVAASGDREAPEREPA